MKWIKFYLKCSKTCYTFVFPKILHYVVTIERDYPTHDHSVEKQ